MNLETREEIAKKLASYYNTFKTKDYISNTNMVLNVINLSIFNYKNNLIKEITNFDDISSDIISCIKVFVTEIDSPSIVNMINEKLNILKHL